MVKNEAVNSTKENYVNTIGPLIIEYLQNFQNKFVRPIPQQKKKLSKAAKLLNEIEDLKAEHEEKHNSTIKNHEQVVSSLKDEISEINAKLTDMKKKCVYSYFWSF